MALRALQKRVRGLFSSRRQQSPSSSPSGQLCAITTGASEHKEKVQGRLHRAAARGDLAWLRRWRWYYKRVGIDPPDRQRRTPLHLASANGHADVIRYLAGKNCKLNVADNLKRTPLMRAAQCQQEKCVAVLLEHGADPNLADAAGNTALHLAVLCGNTTVAGLLLEHNASSDAENQEGYTPLNLAVSKHEEMLECLLKKAADGYAAEQCERTALVVTTSHEADVEEDKLHLQEELEKVKVQLQEIEEKYLNSERCVQNLMAASEEKEREELAAVLELQDELSAYLDNQSTVKRQEEHMLCLEIQHARLEATVQQQNNRFEALQRDQQATASLQEIEEKCLNSEHCVQNLMAALEKEKEATASAMKLQDQVLKNLETVKQLEEQVQRLGFEKTCLEATVQQQSNRIEALQRDQQASASAQAASQDRLEHIRASHHASPRNQLKDRIRDLECELDKIKNTPQDSTSPKECAQSEMAKDKELYLEKVKTRRCLAKKVERANERLDKDNAKLLWKRLKRQSSVISNTVSGDLAAAPVLHSTALGHLGKRSRLDSRLSAADSFQKQREKYLSSRRKLVASVAKVQQEQEKKLYREMEKATAELEIAFARLSKKFHSPQDPLSRAKY